MVKRQEYQRRSGGQSNTSVRGQRNTSENGTVREHTQSNYNNRNNQNKTYHRDNSNRQNYSSQNSYQRSGGRIKVDETIDDIKADITRLEKEIQLELKEIRSMKLGL